MPNHKSWDSRPERPRNGNQKPSRPAYSATQFLSRRKSAATTNQVLEAQTARTIRSPSPRPSPSGRGRLLAPLSAVSEAVRDTDAIFSARGGAIVLPLSEGEGRGEGEGLVRLDPCSKAHLRPNLNFRSMFSPDAVKLPRADEEQASIRDGGRGVIAVAEIVHREHAKFRAGLKHVAFAGVREEQ